MIFQAGGCSRQHCELLHPSWFSQSSCSNITQPPALPKGLSYFGELGAGRVAGRCSGSDMGIGRGREAREVEGGAMRQRGISSLQHESTRAAGHVRLRLRLNLALR